MEWTQFQSKSSLHTSPCRRCERLVFSAVIIASKSVTCWSACSVCSGSVSPAGLLYLHLSLSFSFSLFSLGSPFLSLFSLPCPLFLSLPRALFIDKTTGIHHIHKASAHSRCCHWGWVQLSLSPYGESSAKIPRLNWILQTGALRLVEHAPCKRPISRLLSICVSRKLSVSLVNSLCLSQAICVSRKLSVSLASYLCLS